MPLKKLIPDENGKLIEVDETQADVADRVARQAMGAAMQQADDDRQADLRGLKQAKALSDQLEADLLTIDGMNAAQVRDVVKRSVTLQLLMAKTLKRLI